MHHRQGVLDAEECCRIESVAVVVVDCDFAPEFITVLPEGIQTDTIKEQAIYSAVELWGN